MGEANRNPPNKGVYGGFYLDKSRLHPPYGAVLLSYSRIPKNMNIKQSQASDKYKIQLANRISEKITQINKQIIYPDKEVEPGLGKDLAEIYLDLKKYRESIDKFVATDIQKREAMEESLIDVETMLKQIESHTKSAHGLFEQMKTYYCWK